MMKKKNVGWMRKKMMKKMKLMIMIIKIKLNKIKPLRKNQQNNKKQYLKKRL
jgi:hypothetical protein